VKKAVVVELKQWQKVQATTKDAIVVTQLGKGLRPVVHPSYQAWSYAALLEGFNEAVYNGGIVVQPCAYLHNYVRDGVIDAPHYAPYIEKAPLFTKGSEEREQLRAFIKQHVKFGDAKAVMYELARGRIRPSKALAESLKGLMVGKPEFVLIDDQKEVFEACLAAARSASSDHPRVVLIEGGPGTGKTVLAINLLVRLTAEGLLGKYVSKNAAPRSVYEAKLAGSVKKSHFSNLFTGSGSFIDTAPDTFDFLIVDEAHRLTEKGGLYGNLGENQIKELIRAAKCTIFFIDEDQRVTLSDIGSKQAIRLRQSQKPPSRGGRPGRPSKILRARLPVPLWRLGRLPRLARQHLAGPRDGQRFLGGRGLRFPGVRQSGGDACGHRSQERPEPSARGCRLLLAMEQQEGLQGLGHCDRRDLPAAVEPRPGRQPVDHGGTLDRAGGLHPHLPGSGSGLHRGDHRA
jgi:hypothetical protein